MKSKLKNSKNIILSTAIAACFNTSGFLSNANAVELNTQLPQEELILNTQINLNLPAQSLAAALKTLSANFGLNIIFNDALVSGKNASAIRGNMTRKEALHKLLSNTGLEARLNDTTIYIQRAPLTTNINEIKLGTMQIRAKRFYEVGPLPGLGLTKEEIPGNVQSITAKDIKESRSLSIADLLNSKLQSVNINDYAGNPFQMDVQYRGFTASPQIGTPQGLSVFLDGIRVNEPFGDVVNWDLIPMNALAGVDIFPGSNPIFGLGTLGGAFAIKTKDGFNNEGVDAEVLTGSYGRKQLQISAGTNNGEFALFGAGNFFLEDGWRDNSPSHVNQVFGKASYRGEKLDLNLSTLLVSNDLVGNGLLPSQMYEQNRSGVFTSPDTTKNSLVQFQLAGAFQVNDQFSITGQVYRRDSKRHSIGADVYTEYEGTSNFVNRDLKPADPLTGKPAEEFTCLYNSTNKYGLPDYYIYEIPDPNDFSSSPFLADFFNTGVPNLSLLPADAFNQDLPDDFAQHAMGEFNFAKNVISSIFYVPTSDDIKKVPSFGPETPYSNGEVSYIFSGLNSNNFAGSSIPGSNVEPLIGLVGFYYYTPDGHKHMYMPIVAKNGANCTATQADSSGNVGGVRYLNPLDPKTNQPTVVDGAGSLQTGVVEGTPTAVLTDNRINQITDGASVQLNWNLEHHKLMVGASIDRPTATYSSGQRLGLLDAQRNAYLAPNEIRDQYAAADQEVHNNDFSGYSTTKSIYVSETWSPVETFHLTGAVRYNETHGKNTLAQRLKGDSFATLAYFQNIPDSFNICPNGVCPTTGYKTPDLSNLIQKPESEEFSYYSLNPSLGVTWQAKENLNIYGNWAQGVRTPSVIELGCAFDHTLIDVGAKTDANGVEIGRSYLEKSLAENRSCQLPTTLSGDPYLPQIKAQTWDVGMRGTLDNWMGAKNVEWNLGAYRSNIKDDIYFVTYPGNHNFFDTVGKTRRQGIEAGMAASFDKLKLKFNYALTDATFQDSFFMASDDNSSAESQLVYCNPTGGGCIYNEDTTRRIQVKPGNRMPGVPLHNLNATMSYDITPAWQVSLAAVAHSDSYVRGNENNQHQTGVPQVRLVTDPMTGTPVTAIGLPTSNPGKVPGYATFNFQTRYKFNSEWTLGMQINNLFDKEYFSAGRLGRNPFSPSIKGAIGPDGYNHNSDDWQSTNFIAPGAPRGIYISLNWQFDPNKNKVVVDVTMPTEPSEVVKPDKQM